MTTFDSFKESSQLKIKGSSLIGSALFFNSHVLIPFSCLAPGQSVFFMLSLLLISACDTLSEFLLLLAVFVWFPTPMPAFSMTSCFAVAPQLKCRAADAAAIATRFLPYHLCLGQMFQTRALIDSLAFCVYPGRHLLRRAGSLRLS